MHNTIPLLTPVSVVIAFCVTRNYSTCRFEHAGTIVYNYIVQKSLSNATLLINAWNASRQVTDRQGTGQGMDGGSTTQCQLPRVLRCRKSIVFSHLMCRHLTSEVLQLTDTVSFMSTVEGVGQQCPICGATYRRRKALTAHMKSHDGQTCCSICGQLISTMQNLRRHLMLIHNLSRQEADGITNNRVARRALQDVQRASDPRGFQVCI